MGLLGELGKAVLEGAVESIQQAQRHQSRQNQLRAMQEFTAHEGEIQDAAEQGDLEAIQILAGMYFRKGDKEKAIYYASKGAEVTDSICLQVIGMIAMSEKEYEVAEKAFTADVNVNGNDESAAMLGDLYWEVENFEAAEHCFDFAFRRNNSNYPAAMGLAMCMIQSGSRDFNKMRQLLQIAARSDDYALRDAAQKLIQKVNEDEETAKNSCFITTAVCDNFDKADDCYELTAFRKFRDCWLKFQSDGKALIDEYYKIAPKIVAKINSLPDAKNLYRGIWDEYLSKCLRYIETKDYSACKNLYVTMVENLKTKFKA